MAAENPKLNAITWHKVGVWCALSATRIIGTILFLDTKNSEGYSRQAPTQFILSLSDDENEHRFFQKKMVQLPIQPIIQSLSYITFQGTEYIINYSLWSAHSSHPMSCVHYLWDVLKTMFINNNTTHTHTQNDLKEIIWIASSILASQELQTVFNNIHQMSIILSVVGSLHMPALTCGKLHYVIEAVNVHSMSRFHFKMDIL